MKKSIFLLFVLPLFVFGQDKLSTEKLWEFGRVSDPQISVDGKSALYGVRNYDVKTNKSNNIIYIASITAANTKALTDKKNNAFAARWRPDGKKITYLSAETGEVQLWEMNPDGSSKSQVSFISGGIDGYKYSPKLNYVAFSAAVKLDNEVKDLYPDLDKVNARIIDGLNYRHWDTWFDYTYNHVFVSQYSDGKFVGNITDIMPGEKFDCPSKPMSGDEDYNWHPSGNIIAYSCKKLNGTEYATSTNSEIYLYDINQKITVNISNGNLGYDKEPQFSPDGKSLVWLSMKTPGYEADKSRLMLYNMEPEQVSGLLKFASKGNATEYTKIDLSEGFDYTVEQFQWSGDSKSIFFTAVYKATKPLFGYFFPIKKGKGQIIKLTSSTDDISAFSANGNSKSAKIVASKMSISSPTELFLIDAGKGMTEKNIFQSQLTFTNKNLLDKIKMGRVEKRMIKSTDGKEILTWVIYPPDFDASKKYPTLLYCQGGPQSPVSQFFSYRWNFQLMAAHGYIIVAPNRRGLPGFGSEWNDQIVGDYGGQCQKDLLSAIDEVSKEPYIDKAKLGAVGASFGGYSVYWLAGNHQKRFKAFIAHCGMFNMESWYGSTEEMFFANYDSKGPYWNQSNHPNNYDASPNKFIQNWDAPILVIHDEKDFRVPVTQGMEAFTAAQIKGIPSRFLYFPDENHWVTKPQNSILWQRVYFDWLDKWLKN